MKDEDLIVYSLYSFHLPEKVVFLFICVEKNIFIVQFKYRKIKTKQNFC